MKSVSITCAWGHLLKVRPSLGVGFRISGLTVDYAYTDLGAEESTYSHIISLHLAIRPKDSR